MVKVSLEPTQWVDEKLFHESENLKWEDPSYIKNYIEPELEVEVVSNDDNVSAMTADLMKLSKVPGVVRRDSTGTLKEHARYYIPLSSLPELSRIFGENIYYKTPQQTIFGIGEEPPKSNTKSRLKSKESEEAMSRIHRVLKAERLLYLNDAPLLSGLRLATEYLVSAFKKVTGKREANALIVCKEEDVLPTYMYMLDLIRSKSNSTGFIDEVIPKFHSVMIANTNDMTREQRDAMYIDFFDAMKGILIVSVDVLNSDIDLVSSFDYNLMVFSGIINYLEEDLKHVKEICDTHTNAGKILIDTEDVLLKPEKLYDVLSAVDTFFVRATLGPRKTFSKEFTKGGEVFRSIEPVNFERLKRLLRKVLIREVPYGAKGVLPRESHVTEIQPYDKLQEALLAEFKGKVGFPRLEKAIRLDPGIIHYYPDTASKLCAEVKALVPQNYGMSNITRHFIRRVKDLILADEKVLILTSDEAERDYLLNRLRKNLGRAYGKKNKYNVPIISYAEYMAGAKAAAEENTSCEGTSEVRNLAKAQAKTIQRVMKWYNEENRPVIFVLTDEELEQAYKSRKYLTLKGMKEEPMLISPYVFWYQNPRTKTLENCRRNICSKVILSVKGDILSPEHKNAICPIEEERARREKKELDELKSLDDKKDEDLVLVDSDLARAFAEALKATSKE